MRNHLVPAWLMALTLLGVGTSGHADFIELDDDVFGPGSITLDTDTLLEWLDVTASEGQSFNTVAGEFGVGGDFEGFSHATDAEVTNIMDAFGVLGVQPPSESHTEFMSFFGITSFQGEFPEIFGYASPLVGGFAPVFGLDFFFSDGDPTYTGLTGSLLHNPDIAFEGFGSWLVRPVPGPGTLALLGVAVIGTGYRRREKAA